MRCAEARVDLSARLDNELDEATARALELHLETCEECRREEDAVRAARRAVRIHPVEDVPDLTDRIMKAVAADGPRLRRRSEWAGRIKVAAVAAAASALVLAGATLPRSPGEGDIASAGEISGKVSSAARSLSSYRASFDIVERGWHPKVPLRHFSAELWFAAPEKLRMLVSDFTAYPDGKWPRNNVQLVANANKWSIEEPTDWQCPLAALRPCAVREQTPSESRTIVDRQPFDGTSHLPTDVIIPLETLVSSGRFRVVGHDTVAGRSAYQLEMPYGDAVPLVDALQAGGSWRPFNPLDTVDLWVDQRTWFPLQFDVVASSSRDRVLWAEQQGLHDVPGQRLLTVKAASFSIPESFPAQTFRVPTRGLVKSGGFEAAVTPSWAPEPRFLAGLDPYRFGKTETGEVVRSYSGGMTWLKVTTARLRPPKPFYPTTAALVDLPGSAGWAYYQPASASLGRRIDIFGTSMHVHLESNLPSEQLTKVAASLGVQGHRAPPGLRRGGSKDLIRIESEDAYERVGYSLTPTYIPEGYDFTTALLTRSPRGGSSLTTYYRGAESDYSGSGLRIAQSRPVHLLTPSSRDFARVNVEGAEGRWAPEIGQLEWIDSGVYRSVTVPSFDLSTAMAIARSLR